MEKHRVLVWSVLVQPARPRQAADSLSGRELVPEKYNTRCELETEVKRGKTPVRLDLRSLQRRVGWWKLPGMAALSPLFGPIATARPLLLSRGDWYAARNESSQRSPFVRVIIEPNHDAASRRAARFVADLVRSRPSCVLGLATGSTPLGMYRELIRLHREEGLDFSQVTTFNLDEYVGLTLLHPQSYRYFMQRNLFDHINIEITRTHVPDGRTADFEEHCRQYEQLIKEVGGIDLQVLGIGSDGHIAFNEPGSSLGSRTRLKTLAHETIRDNARFFGGEDKVPRLAVTMGVGTILESRRCLLLAFGPHKAVAVRDTVEGPVTAQVTASALQLHREVIGIFDEAAARLLVRRDYYAEVEHSQALFEAGEFKHLGIGNQ